MANEKRLIDADAVAHKMFYVEEKNGGHGWVISLEDLSNAPTVDAVEVVLCKDCKHCTICYPEKQIGKEPTPGWYCKEHKSYRRPDDFCSYGERREGE